MYVYVKMYQTLCFKYTHYIVCQLYLKRAVGREEGREGRKKGAKEKGKRKEGSMEEGRKELQGYDRNKSE